MVSQGFALCHLHHFLERLRSEELVANEEVQSNLCNKYTVLERLGRGSSGQVFRARRREDGAEVALKIMSAAGPDVLASRQAEFEILRQLRHPNIVQGFEFLCSGTTAAIALSYHPGSTLQKAVRDSPAARLPETDSQRLARQLVSAVAYLHEHRIVHRDVKAENLLVSPDLWDLHLVDFNTARPLLEGGALTMTGTVEYSAPEVLSGESPSDWQDVWGAGLCLHFMLLGTLPHRLCGYRDVGDFAAAVSSRPVTCEGPEWQAISQDCRHVVRRSLAISKHQRPAALLLLALPWLRPEPQVQRRLGSEPVDAPDLPATTSRSTTLGSFVVPQ